ncbi:MAG TPA: DUF86 domain-containing protein [Candidatus Nanoarchaeia archaeon]|nr:DUF86 domain-containing protein [Candidatus Nanoarchaeia archaeon]
MRTAKLYLKDILDAVNLIEKSIKGISQKKFDKDKDIQDATIRRITIIGEAAKNVPQPFRREYADVPWKDVAGMRDVLIHAYFGVKLDKVWNVVNNDLPQLKKQIQKIIESLGEN